MERISGSEVRRGGRGGGKGEVRNPGPGRPASSPAASLMQGGKGEVRNPGPGRPASSPAASLMQGGKGEVRSPGPGRPASSPAAALMQGGKGEVRSPGSDGVQHAPSRDRLDEMVAGGGEAEPRPYGEGLTETRNDDPDVGPCGERKPVAGEIRDALSRDGEFLRAGAIRELKKLGYGLRSDLPVSVAPFLSDPSKQPGAASQRNPPNRAPVTLLNKTAFQSAAAASQGGSQRKDRTIDICASIQHPDSVYTAVVGVEWRDPARISWVFSAQNEPAYDYSVVTRSGKSDDDWSLRLMKVTKSDAEGDDICLHKRRTLALPDGTNAVADRGTEIAHGSFAEHGRRGTSLRDAANRVLEGTFGLIVDAVTNQAVTGAGNVLEEHYVPIIVTTASLLTYEHNPDAPDPERPDAPDTDLKSASVVVYHCPHPACARFPDQIVSAKNARQARLAEKWPVVVTTVEGLKSMLSNPRAFRGVTQSVQL